MKVNRLTIKDFKGLRDYTLFPGGKDAAVYGRNGTGKTTICDIYAWIFADKNSHLESKFDIKTFAENGENIPNMDHEAEIELEIDGVSTTLKKTFHEVYTKKRGLASKDLTGHKTDHSVDGVPVTKKEYDARVSAIIGPETFLTLTTPYYFADVLHYTIRRKILLDICGDVTDSDVINSDSELAELDTILNGRKHFEYKKIIQAQQKELNKKLKEIPIRISEKNRDIEFETEIDIESERQKIIEIKDNIAENEQRMKRIWNGAEIQDQENYQKKIQTKILTIENQLMVEIQDKKKKRQDVLNSMNKKKNCLLNDLDELKTTTIKLDDEIKEYLQKIKDLREVWFSVNDRKFEKPIGETCPTCGQKIPGGQIIGVVEQALSEFNLKKSKDLQKISEDGQLENKQLDQSRERLKAIAGQIDSINEAIKKLDDEIKETEKKEIDVVQPDELAVYRAQFAEAEKTIKMLKISSKPEIDKINETISMLEEALKAPQEKIKMVQDAESSKKRVTELEEQEKAASQEYEKLESHLFVMDQFTRRKVEMMEASINSHFKLAKFRMFKTQVNGGLDDCCDVTFKGVPFSSCSGGEKIIVGLDIIETLQKHYGIKPPIFIDEAGEITSDIDIACQVLRFIASKEDEVLRVELG